MPQPRFDKLSERLLRAGIAPRHVRRYVGELRDHFDDLVREEIDGGATRDGAAAKALSRLGNNDDLVQAMLVRPGVRSMTARFPLVVFGFGPLLLLFVSIVGAALIDIGVLDLTGVLAKMLGAQPHRLPPAWFTLMIATWNTTTAYGAPLAVAALIYFIGKRQHMSSTWIVAGIAIACIIGGFQNLSWYDTGTKGELELTSGLYPPFPDFAAGVARAIAGLAAAAGTWWLTTRAPASPGMEFSPTAQS
jgi:hypothetical protein